MAEELQTLKLVDSITGEVIQDIILLRKRRKVGGLFVKVFQDTLEFVAKSHLRGVTLNLFIYVLANVGYDNILPARKRIKKDLEMSASNVSRAMKDLIKIGAIIEIEDTFILNPRIGWKGSNKALDEIIPKINIIEKNRLLSVNNKEGLFIENEQMG